ncbi:hypothetical protein GU334_02735 [Lactococcus raffinolactis]|uniref:Distal tail protein N-terminal domain-containing protein n=1 Tax=Pseudolactococcus raffinolactis TaxID=1366 RepID=A0AAE6YKA9_9LACT|nr:phage distal tail protein domain-containing protein [Lactococcus raffinolactis]QIW57902.1 hypothetical protein GU334_02735 [Lactococcus raffinolactis]
MIRKISMLNGNRDLLDFSDREKFLLYDVSGLGVEFDNKVDIFNASVLMNSQNLKLGQLKAKLLVGQNSVNGYEIFSEMFRFLNSPPYTVIYETDTGIFYRDCVLNKLTKSDMKKGRIFIEDVVFDFLTPFYKEISETYKPNSDTEGDGKIYAGTNKPRNLIANPNFLNNMESWDNMSDPDGTYQLQAPTSDKPNSNILKLTSSNNKLSSFMNAWGLKVRKGDRLSFRVDIKTENNPDYDKPVIRVGYGTGEKNYKYSDFGITSSSSGFKTATISFVVPQDGVFQLYLINQNWSTLGSMSTYFREPMLIRGDVSDMPVEQYDNSYPNLNLLTDSKDFKNKNIAEPLATTSITSPDSTIVKDGNDTYLHFLRPEFKSQDWFRAYMIRGSSISPNFPNVDVKSNTHYTFSVWLKGTGTHQIIAYNNWTSPNPTTLTVTLTDNWTKYVLTVNTATTIPTQGAQFFIRSGTVGSEINLKYPKVEEGSTATPWMPSDSEVKPTDYPSYMPGFYEGKQVYDSYVYSYVYESDYNGKSGVFQIENNSVYIGSAKGSPVEITVHGPCTNPYWEILDGSKVIQSDGYNIDVPDGYKLVVSSVVQKQRVKLIAPDGTISDVYQQQDLSKSNFVTIPEGRVTLAFHNVGDVSFNYREEYITV